MSTTPAVNVNGLIGFNNACGHVHDLNARWWYDSEGRRLARNQAEMIALMHSELSEMLEGVRKGHMDKHLPERSAEEVELADAIIRMMDYAGAYGFDLEGAIMEKLAYNQRRRDHTYEARAAEGGKKF